MEKSTATRHDPFAMYDPDILVAAFPVEIDAPAMVVWDILTAFDRYGEWNPLCVWAAGSLFIGAAVNMRLVNYANPGSLAQNCEYICGLEEGRLLSWELPDSEAWPYPARRDQLIDELGPDRCRYQSTDAGPNGIHVMRFCGDWIARAFNDSAQALQSRAEAMYRGDLMRGPALCLKHKFMSTNAIPVAGRHEGLRP